MRRIFACTLVALLSMIHLLTGQVIIVQDSVKESPVKSKSLLTLSPEREAKLKEILSDLKSEKTKFWANQMKTKIADLVKLTGIGQDKADALEAASKPIVEKAVDIWIDEPEKRFRSMLEKFPGREDAILNNVSISIHTVAQNEAFGGTTPPDESDDWVKAVHSSLTADQAALWDKDRDAQTSLLEKEMGDFLNPSMKIVRDRENAAAEIRCMELESSLALDSDRKGKLEALAKSASDQSATDWKTKVELLLRGMDSQSRSGFILSASNIKTSGTSGLFGLSSSFSEQPVWKDGLAKLLTTQERTKLENLTQGRAAERAHIIGKVFIMLMDEKVAFTTAQRDQLQPIAERLVRDISSLYPDPGSDSQDCPVQLFYSAAQDATDAELKPILDDLQIKRWRALVSVPENGANNPAAISGENAEPEYVEKAIGRVFYEKEKDEREKILQECTLNAEDVIRKTGVSGDSAVRLEIAARGAAEKKLSMWKIMTEQQTRNQLQDATSDNIDQRLAGLQNYFFQFNNRAPQGDVDGLWEKALKDELNPKQQTTWETETKARHLYHDAAITDLVISNFDHYVRLSADQEKKFTPLILQIVSDYAPDIPRIFPAGSGTPWYLMSNFELMPLAGADEDQMKAILTQAQMTAWTERTEYANCANTWGVVKQLHIQRIHINDTP